MGKRGRTRKQHLAAELVVGLELHLLTHRSHTKAGATISRTERSILLT